MATYVLAWSRVQPNLERVVIITVVHIDCIEGWVPWLWRGPAIGQGILQLVNKVVVMDIANIIGWSCSGICSDMGMSSSEGKDMKGIWKTCQKMHVRAI